MEERLIDANALLEQFERVFGYDEITEKIIDDAPTIEAVRVVRCRECRHSRTDKDDHEDIYYCDRNDGYAYHSMDFCSYGERKDGMA